MFGADRPDRVRPRITVACDVNVGFACARCKHAMALDDVALFTRTHVDEAFDPWCPPCAYILLRWASVGAMADTKAGDEAWKKDLAELLNDVSD